MALNSTASRPSALVRVSASVGHRELHFTAPFTESMRSAGRVWRAVHDVRRIRRHDKRAVEHSGGFDDNDQTGAAHRVCDVRLVSSAHIRKAKPCAAVPAQMWASALASYVAVEYVPSAACGKAVRCVHS